MTKITSPFGRDVEEWIGATPNTPVPERVKLRVFERHNGICHISKRRIRGGEPWDVEHVIAIINGGENRESNLAPALKSKHPEKTARDVTLKAVTARKKAKHLGVHRKGRGFYRDPNKVRGVDGVVRERKGTRYE